MDRSPGRLRTLLVGLDAADLPLLSRLRDDDAVPALGRLLDEGVAGSLPSQIPPWTPSAWPSMYTGTNPGKHGVFGFLDFDGYEWSLVNATHVRERPIWEHLDQYGLSSVIVNVPVTHPPRSFEGALIPGYTAPEDPACHPAGLLDDVRADVGDYRIYPESDADPSVEEYRELVRMRGRTFRYLTERFDPDFGFLQFQVTDTVFHDRPGDAAAVRSIYEAVDDEVGAVLETCEPTNVIVASDHGIGEYGGYTFRVNEFLRRAGFVETRRGGLGMPSWGPIRDTRIKAGSSEGSPDRGTLTRLVAHLARVGLTSQRIAGVLATLGVDDAVRRRVPTSVISAGTEQVDFAASRAYMRSRIECGVRINLEGREPEGVVPREEYTEVRDELVSLLSSARTPDGDPVFADVAPREAYFDGRAAGASVDVVTVPADFDHFLSAGLAADVFDEPEEPWNHKLEGLVAATGAAFDESGPIDGARLVDVAPTVLATLGVPVDDRMDGTPLPIVEPSEVRAYPPVRRRPGRATDEPAVERRLENLGYLDRSQ